MAYTAFTWSEVRERLKDRYESKPFWNAEEARLAFNEGLLTFNLLTGRWKQRVTILTVANQYEYVLPATMVYRMRVEHNGYPLSPSNREDLNNGRYRWRTETTASGGDVPTRPTVWAPISLELIYLWPADAVTGNTLTLDGIASTPVLIEDGDTLDLGDEHLNALLDYALHALCFKIGGPAFGETAPLFQSFLAVCAEENDQIKTSQTYRRFMGIDDRGFKRFRSSTPAGAPA